jgi:Flp pilus assembly protein TadD
MSRKLLFCLSLLVVPAVSFAGELLFPDGVQLYNKAVNAQKAGNFEQAESDYKKTLLLMGTQALEFRKYILNNRAMIAIQRGDLDQAESLLQEAVSIDFRYKPAVTNLGFLYMRKGEFEKALKTLSTVMDFPRDYSLEDAKPVEEMSVFK